MEVWSDEGDKRERRAAPGLLFKLLGSLSLFCVSKENTHTHAHQLTHPGRGAQDGRKGATLH